MATLAALMLAAPATAQSTREFFDEAGRRVVAPQPVRRIVSLAPSVTETLFALGVGDRVVGVTDFCDYPPEAARRARVGGPLNPSLEHIAALNPDVVVLAKTANRRETMDAISRLGIAAYGTDPRSVEQMLDSTLRLSRVVGAEERGQQLVAELRARLDALRQRLAGRRPKRILFLVWYEPLITVGYETFLFDAVRWAGGESVVKTSQEWPRLNLEEAIRLEPEYIVIAEMRAEGVERTAQDLRTRRGWRDMDAVRNNRFGVLDVTINRPGPRLVDAIERLARQLHPDAFAEANGKGWQGPGVAQEHSGPFLPLLHFPISLFHGGAAR
ncbi:MAG TPA: cobalamin-binding protein [Candidatus Acidoferrales bacterium]